jgi:AAA domain/UvrD-like helicase C-terminal domain
MTVDDIYDESSQLARLTVGSSRNERPVMSYTPTAEQAEVLDAFGFGADLVVQARAGSGKTTTLKMLAASTRERGVYVAYNKAIATDAARDFPSRVTCRTAHALAFAAVGKRYGDRLRGPRVPAREAARMLGVNDPLRYADDRAPLAPAQVARLAMDTVRRFCYSSDDQIGPGHVPYPAGVDDPASRRVLALAVVPLARRAWDNDLTRTTGRLRFDHDMYLKMWCLTRPQLGADYVLLDEAQDANPAVAALVEGQHSQRVLVGDACQAIYGWRGAVDAMSTFAGQRLTLSQSFRFGQRVADEANKWLALLDSSPPVTGLPSITSVVGPLDVPDAVLCRTNAGALATAMQAMDGGRKAALVGGAGDLRQLAEAALTLRMGQGCHHPELCAFRTWDELRDYAADSAGSDLRALVDLIDRYGPTRVVLACDALVDEDVADVVVSTAHRSKGREWESVTIAEDFREPRDPPAGLPGEVPREEAMLAYVAVTRARHRLDRTGLMWVDRHIAWRSEEKEEEEA